MQSTDVDNNPIQGSVLQRLAFRDDTESESFHLLTAVVDGCQSASFET